MTDLRTKQIRQILASGLAIPAHPLALTPQRKLDERRQRALSRYYLAAGAGGLAVGVHTTQFEIREPHVGLYRPVLELAIATIREHRRDDRPPVLGVAGICGATEQAIREASLAADLGYHAGLLSLAALKTATDDELIAHCRRVADVIPLFGFYLQPAVGGRVLSYDFWRRFAEIDNVVGIKMAPFNRYRTIDVVRAVAESGRAREVLLYTGNDDNIVLDLLTTFRFRANGQPVEVRLVGGLLGHWAVWTKRAVELVRQTRSIAESGQPVPACLLSLAAEITDSNTALFDVAHDFAGCIPGIHEVLRRQGLLEGTWCLNPHEQLSPGQAEEIDRVCRAYPHLTDDDFVAAHRDEWLR
jgi:dihydrodipicolinate synthase/N-acetylneuraminate lyase